MKTAPQFDKQRAEQFLKKVVGLKKRPIDISTFQLSPHQCGIVFTLHANDAKRLAEISQSLTQKLSVKPDKFRNPQGTQYGSWDFGKQKRVMLKAPLKCPAQLILIDYNTD